MTAPVGYVALPWTVITEPTDKAVQAGVTAWLTDRTTAGFMRTRLMFNFIGTAELVNPLLPANTGQLQGVEWEGLSKRGTVLQWADPKIPLLSARGQLRNFRFAKFSVQSTVPAAQGFYFLSSTSASNQDGEFHRIEWMGSWSYGIGLNGPGTANLNSEIVLDQVALSNDASFVNGWLWSGMGSKHAQEDQFVNYSIANSKLEGSHGTYLNFERGGCIRTYGFNSWLHTGQAAPGQKPQGTMILLGAGPHADSTCILEASGVRAELRGPASKLIDSAWGSNGHIVWNALDTTADSFAVGNIEEATYRGTAHISYRDCGLGGWHHVTGQDPAEIVYDNCHSKSGNPFKATPLTGNGQVRFDTTTQPSVIAG